VNTQPSLIVSLHARYEAAWVEYNTIDSARVALNKKNEAERLLDFSYEDAMKANHREIEALRLAIFYQVPTTWQEALLLQYHVHSILEPSQAAAEEEAEALATAVDTLFDFMCDEIEHEDVEGLFQRGEHLVSERRHRRTGKLQA
jgi:hypothetical protein